MVNHLVPWSSLLRDAGLPAYLLPFATRGLATTCLSRRPEMPLWLRQGYDLPVIQQDPASG